ncbi:MAG: hypothetical protein Gaeavirus4_20 [Gaeavirus sp.]|uniref:RING-type domain-containing protein n=1 Tax=Gaeavirus sp. TaxID=2487767 RepID=A0A3G4ZYK3_9VIRU|nr:MAG: hypothetical protein Gaeavirus4_20 [Gaeavirus sp.]
MTSDVVADTLCKVALEKLGTMCIGDRCYYYYGSESTDGYCSRCYNKIHGLPVPIQIREQLYIDESPASTKKWLKYGIYKSKLFKTECSICFENKYTTHRYACKCDAAICGKCAISSVRCPFCRANIYCRLTVDDIVNILDFMNTHNSSEAISKIMRIMYKLMETHNITDTNMTLRNLIASTDDIVAAILIHQISTKCNVHYHKTHTIFSFSIDPWYINHACAKANINNHDGCLQSKFVGETYKKWHDRRFSYDKFLDKFSME